METAVWTVYLCFWLAVAGAALGSFLDCAVSRWAAGENPFKGRSRCDSCGRTLPAGELVPILSFLLQRGRCRGCGQAIPRRCLLSEVAGLGLFLALGACIGPRPVLGMWVIWAGLLLAVSLADAAKRVIPDQLLVALALNRLVWFFLLGEDWKEAGLSALGGCAVAAALLALVLAGERLTGQELMGGGDIKLMFALGLYFDWPRQLLTLLGGCLLGLLWAAAGRRSRGSAIPFGPFLALGAAATLCFGGPLVDWYMNLF